MHPPARQDGDRWGTDEEDALDVLSNPNTAKATATAMRAYHDWQLARCRDATPLDEQPRAQILARLARFALQLRSKDGGRYKRNSFLTFFRGIQRHLNAAAELRRRSDGVEVNPFNFQADVDCRQMMDNINKALGQCVGSANRAMLRRAAGCRTAACPPPTPGQ